MSFTMDDVMELLKIIKECKDVALHIDTYSNSNYA